MARKTFAFIGILTVLLMSLGMVSAVADIQISNINFPTIYNNQTSAQFTFDITYGGTSSDMDISFNDSTTGVAGVTLSIPTEASMNGTADETRSVTGVISGIYGKSAQTISVVLNASTEGGAYNFTSTSFQILDIPTPSTYNFCDDFSGEKGTLEISDFTIVNLGEGDDEEWELLDEIEIEVEVENTDRNDDVDDVMVEIMILDNNDNDVTNDFDIADEEIDLGRIKDDDSEVAVFTIKEIPADLDDGEYKLYFRAYSEGDEDSHCIASSNDFDEDTYQEIEVIRLDSKAVIVKPEWTTVLASCGDKYVEVTLDVYNIGEDKEEKILVSLFNSKLNINEKVVINDLRSGKRQEITFVFDVPENLDDKYYNLDIVTYYDYDDGEDELSEFSYDESSYNDLDKDFSVRLEILSCKGPDPTLTASLESIAEMGTELIVKATITNNDEDNDFIISASDFDAWATMVSIAPQTIFIAKGESAEVLITFNPTTTGSHSFKINTIVGGESYDQSVSVIIEEKPGIFADLDNTTLYIIVGILVVLISIILTVIVKASRRRVKPEF